MWTRLMYLKAAEALKPQFKNGKFYGPALSGRYRSLLRKQFLMVNLNLSTLEGFKEPKKNPRHKMPKGHKFEKKKLEHLKKVQESLSKADEEEQKYRLKRLNQRDYGGIDEAVKKASPSMFALLKDPSKYVPGISKGRVKKAEKDSGDDVLDDF